MYNYAYKNEATGASVSNIRKNGSRAEATEQKNTILASAKGTCFVHCLDCKCVR